LCEETDRRISYILNKCKQNLIKINRPEDKNEYLRIISSIESGKRKGHDLLFDTIEQEVREVETFVLQASDTIEEISKNIKMLEDYKEVVEFISEMMHNLDGAQPA